MTKVQRICVVGLMFAGMATLSACDKVKKSIACEQLCKHYKDCYDSDLKLSKCQSRCYDSVDDSKRVENAVSDCVDCAEDRACAEIEDRCSTCDDAYTSFNGKANEEPDASDDDASDDDAGEADAGEQDAGE